LILNLALLNLLPTVLLEHLHWCSVCDPAPLKSNEEKSKYLGLAQGNGFWLTMILLQFAVAGERCNNNVAPAEKSVINMI
jgi:hypothetical protein